MHPTPDSENPHHAAARAPSNQRIAHNDLILLLQGIFLACGASDSVARVLAENCAAAERDGATSHGVFRIPGYVATIASGWVTPNAVPVVEDVGPGFLRVNANNGFAQPALEAARLSLLDKVDACGVACLAIRNSHHFSALWPDVEPFARDGLIALAMVNSKSRVVPAGGTEPVYGTNPMAFAVPCAGKDPIVFDQAASSMAHGDLKLAAIAGRQVPLGTGVDRHGAPTTDPAAILDGGALLPFGGYKGSSIAMMVEVMAAALTGGNFSHEVDWSDHSGAEIPKTGEFLLVVDPRRGGNTSFDARIAELLQRLADSGQMRIPGDQRYRRRRESLKLGIPIEASELQKLKAMLK